MAEHNKLTPLSPAEMDPYRVEGSDFPAKISGKAGDASGKNMLVDQSSAQESPRSIESESADGPSVWGKGGKSFSVGKSKGEGEAASTAMPISCAVDIVSGQISPNVINDAERA